MQDGTHKVGTPAGAGAQRRTVSADSFRRLTALLKKPAAAEPAAESLSIPELLPQIPAVEAAQDPVLPEDPPQHEAAPVDIPAPVEPEPTTELEVQAEAPADAEINEVALAVEPSFEFAAPVIAAPVYEPESAPAEALAPEVETETAQVAEEVAEAAAEVLPVSEELPPEPPLSAEPALEPAPQAEAFTAEPELPVDAPPAEPEPLAEVVAAEAELPVAAPPAEPAPRPPESRTVTARLVPTRARTPDAFSLIPDAPANARSEPEIHQTPEQEAESAELAQSLMDMMAASAGGGQPQERALASDTLLRLLPRLPARTRTTLAQRLTMMDAPPPFLVAKLIADRDLAVSGPMLEDCMQISDEDLLQVIASGHPDKRRLIARRRRISRPVSEALAATSDSSVLITLVRNQGAEISAEGFALLAQAAAQNNELLPPLCTRQDLPVHFAFELFWLVPAQLRRYLLSRFLTDSENLTKILRITMDSHGEPQAAAAEIDLATIGHALETFMAAETSVAGRDEQINLLAAAAKVKPATVERILQDDQGEPLMALLKVLGVPRSMLEAEIHQFANGSLHLIDPLRSLSEVQAVFDQLSFTKARILLTYWDWATTNSGPYAPIN